MINKECDESSLQQFQTVYSVVSRDGLAQVRCLSWMNTALGMGWEGATDICVTSVTCWRGRTRDTWSTRRCSTTASRFVRPTFMATGTTYHIFTLYVNINHTTVWTSNALIHSVGRDRDPGSKEADYIISPFLHFDLLKRFFLPWMFFIICQILLCLCSRSLSFFSLPKPHQYSFNHYAFHSFKFFYFPNLIVLLTSLHVPDSQRGSELQGAGSKPGGKKESKKKRKCKTQLAPECAR